MPTKKEQQFLDSFQQFEKILKESTNSSDQTNFRDALNKIVEKNIYVSKNRGLIEDLYALRNVFAHRERGKYVASISKVAIAQLNKITKAIQNPPKIKDKFGVKVFQAKVEDSILTVMQEMHEHTYTHIPVWEIDKIIGVFSYTSFFHWLLEAQINQGSEKVTFNKKFIGDISRKYLNAPAVNFQFIEENCSTYEIPAIFEAHTKNNNRLDCLLITKNGKKHEKITGIITAWDLGRIL